MQKINGTEITLTKGDTFKAIVTMKTIDGKNYTPSENDVIRFAMKKNYNDENVLIEKVIPNGTLLLELTSTETKNLNVGNYVYDIQITYENGDVDTFINMATFTLTKEVV